MLLIGGKGQSSKVVKKEMVDGVIMKKIEDMGGV